jgi:hypothetical protein
MNTRIAVNILKPFRHIYGNKDVQMKEGQVYYLDISKPDDKNELIYMMGGSFPYRFFISIDITPELLDLLNDSKFDVYSVPPSAPVQGQTYFNDVSGIPYIYNGSSWTPMTGSGGGGGGTPTVVPALFGDVTSDGYSNNVQIVPGVITDADISPTAGIQLSKLATNPLDRTNHTGTQLASTISNFIPTVQTVPVNQLAPATGNLNMNNYRIINLANPISGSDAANKQYVDSAIAAVGFTSPLPLNKGGTGVAATTGVEALNALEGVYSGRNLPVSGTPPLNSGRVFAQKSTGTGSTPSYLDFRRIVVTAPLSIIESADAITIGFTAGGGTTLDINTALSGYPLSIVNGGTGATTATNARVNLGAVGRGENSLAPSTTVGNVFRDVVNSGGDITMRFNSLSEVPLGGIDINETGGVIQLSVRQSDLSLANIGGSIDLTSSQVTGVLPIAKGGTGATTISGARDNLNVVYDARLITGATGQSVLSTPAVVQQIGDGGIINMKGIIAGSNITITSSGTDLTINSTATSTITAANLGTGDGKPYHSVTGTTLNFRSVQEGMGIDVVNSINDIVVNLRSSYIGTTGARIANLPLAASSPLEFRTLLQGTGITITENTNDITISSTGASTVFNVGGKPGQVYRDLLNGILNLRTIGGATGTINQDGLLVTTVGDEIHIQSNIVDAASLATGQHILTNTTPITTTGNTLNFKGVLAGKGVSLASSTGTDVVIDALLASVGPGVPTLVSASPAVGAPYQLKTVQAGTGITVTDNGTSITIASSSTAITGDYGLLLTGSAMKVEAVNLGGQQVVLANPTGGINDPMNFKGLTAGKGTSLALSTGTEIIIDTLIASIGSGQTLLGTAPTNGQPFNFKSLLAGTGITLTPAADSITISSSAPTGAVNVGTGQQVYKALNAGVLEFRTILGDYGINATTVGDTVNIAAHAENLPGAGQLVLSTASQGSADPLRFKNITPAPTNPGISVTADVNNIFLQAHVSGVAQVGTGVSLTTSVLPLTPGSILNLRTVLGGYGINAAPSTSTNEVLISAHAENIGTGVNVLSNPTSTTDTDPMKFRKILAGPSGSITVNVVTDDIVIDSTGTGIGYSTSAALAPVSNLGIHRWTVTHNLGLPSPFTQFTFSAYDSVTGDYIVMDNITGVDGNTAVFTIVTGGASPSTSTHFRITKAL